MTTTGGLQAWLMPVFVTAAVVLLVLIEGGISWLLRRRGEPAGQPVPTPEPDRRIQTVGLGLLVLLAIGVVGMAGLGPTRADQFASVIAALLGAVSAVLTFFSYRDSQDILRRNRERKEAAAAVLPEPEQDDAQGR